MRVFLSYRRDDAAGHAGRLADQLVARYGPDAVFMDVETIEAGADFVEAIDQAIVGADAVLVVIGPGWVQATGPGGRRLDDPADFVRVEVETALGRGVRTIPVLVGGAPMPGAAELPPSLAPLVRMNGVELVDRRFHADVQALVDALEGRSARTGAGEVHLPAQLTPFVGREDELVQLEELLRTPGVRLVTLTGPGGTGKTRLAIQVAARLLDAYPDGVSFVSLASIDTAGLVIPTIAQALGVRDRPETDVADALAAHLDRSRALLLLDNLEHLDDAGPAVATLLSAAAQVAVLATSRSPLHIRGERVFDVQPLAVPDPAAPVDVERLAGYGAVALFVERASAASAEFVLDRDNAPTIAAICSRLDGLPLAIELAAARTPLLPPKALLARLEHRLSVLTGGPRDQEERQRTLRAAIDWSHDLLTHDEQRLFARLGAFSGGCTLDAAQAVCSTQLDLNILEGVSTLFDRSLLRRSEMPDGEPRYWMLETLREYAIDALASLPDEDAVRERHARHYADLAIEIEEAGRARGGDPRFDSLGIEALNCLTGLRWSVNAGRHDIACGLAYGLFRFWITRGIPPEGIELVYRALDEAPPDLDPEIRAQGLVAAGELARFAGDDERAIRLKEEELALFRTLEGDGYEREIAATLTDLSSLALGRREYARARELLDEAILIRRGIGHPGGIAHALAGLGDLAMAEGDHERSRSIFEEVVSIERTERSRSGIYLAIGLASLGESLRRLGRASEATRCIREALELAEPLQDVLIVSACLHSLALVGTQVGTQVVVQADAIMAVAAATTIVVDAGLKLEDEESHEELVVRLKTETPEGDFERAWSRGASMSFDEALTFGLRLAGDLAAAPPGG